MADNSDNAGGGGAPGSRKQSTATTAAGDKRHGGKKKGPSVNEVPTLRQHPKPFYDNFVTKGITHEMSQQRRGNEGGSGGFGATSSSFGATGLYSSASDVPDVNKRKLYNLPGDANATNPPYHIAGDDERVRDAGAYCRTQERLRVALVAADANADGFVTLKEFSTAIQQAADRFLPQQQMSNQFRLLDPDGTGRVSIADAVATSVRTLATRPSQRQSVGVGNVLAWNDAEDARDPGASAAALVGGSTNAHRYYGLTGTERVATSPQREALLPGLNPRVAGISSSQRLRDVDALGGTSAPLIRAASSSNVFPFGGSGPTSGAPQSSPRKVASPRGGTHPSAPASPRGAARGAGGPPPSPRYAAGPNGANRTSVLRAQYLQQEEAHQAALESSYFPKATAQSPRFATPRGANHAPRPGVHIAGVRPVDVAAAAA